MNRHSAQNRSSLSTNDKRTLFGLLAVLGGGLLIWVITSGMLPSSDQDTFTSDDTERYNDSDLYTGASIPGFTQQDAEELSRALDEAARPHGDLCLGWRLLDGTGTPDPEPRGVGSSEGPNVPADRCSRWAEVVVTVAYGDNNDWDAAEIAVNTSPDLHALITEDDFVSSGITADALVAEPVGATGQAALLLPLLLTEQGELEPASPADSAAEPPDEAAPPTGGGNGAWMVVAWLGVLVLITIGALLGGFLTRARMKRESRGDGPGGPGEPGGPGSPGGPGGPGGPSGPGGPGPSGGPGGPAGPPPGVPDPSMPNQPMPGQGRPASGQFTPGQPAPPGTHGQPHPGASGQQPPWPGQAAAPQHPAAPPADPGQQPPRAGQDGAVPRPPAGPSTPPPDTADPPR
ncbi:hypothetical protein [Salinifilum ghardaiensis]